MPLNRNKADVLKGAQMLEKEEEKDEYKEMDEYKVYKEKDEYKVSALRRLRPKQVNPGGWTCRKRTYRLSNNLYVMQDSRN